jgi:hypothetical protein
MANKHTYPKFHLWTKTANVTRCLISSHGEDDNNKFVLPPNVTVIFYVDAGEVYQKTTSEALDLILGKGGTTYKFNSGSLCPDYKLYKLQEYHADTMGGPMQLINKAIHKIKPGGLEVEERMEEVQFLVDNYAGSGVLGKSGSTDIVTIRFRPFNEICRLSDIVNTLRISYTEFHCAFCRS